jgi:P-type DNA transfer ATPase VirB11
MNMELNRSEIVQSSKGRKALDVLRGALRPILSHLDNPNVQEIMINRPEEIWVEESGVMQRIEASLQPLAVEMAIRALASNNDKKLTPIMDARLPDMRVAAVMYPIAIHGHAMSLRKHAAQQISLHEYVANGAFSPFQVAEAQQSYRIGAQRPSEALVQQGGDFLRQFLTWAVEHRHNVLIAGGTSSGKTTLTNALLQAIPANQRVITIEDTAELKLDAPNRVSFEANRDLGVDVRALVRVCLRFRPDRIVVGEIRGGEAYDLVDSLNTGHSGGISTIHADTAESALNRMESLMRMSPEAVNFPQAVMARQIAQTFRFVVQAANLGGQRGPVRVVEIMGFEQDRYQFREIFSRFPAGHPQ